MDYLRIWADDDGVSHFTEVTLPLDVIPAEPGVAELWWSDGVDVDRVHFLTVRATDQHPDWHRAPRRQFVTFLTGWVRLTAGDGEERVLPAGSTVLAEDLEGTGHITEHEPGDHHVLVLPLVPD
jgi:quercetin dioxygenase-like cupin family protein